MATETVIKTRPDQEPLPRRMQNLPIDPDRGYVVPWFVQWLDGKPEFRAMNMKHYVRAIKEKLCWVCGTKLETRFAFVAGGMCGINRVSSEPPSHVECARWSARNCPFLSKPDMVRREDDLIDGQKLREVSAGYCITRNPGVAMVWITREYEVFDDGKGKPLILIGRPHAVEFYCRGRVATRAEIDDSLANGIVALETAARTELGGIEALRKQQRQFEKLLPKK